MADFYYIDYKQPNPYRSYVNKYKNDLDTDFHPDECKIKGWIETFVLTGVFTGLSIALPLYRIYLNAKDVFVTINDYYSQEYKAKRGARLVFNITATLILDPFYTLAGIVQSIIGLAMVILLYLPGEPKPAVLVYKAGQWVEWKVAELYAQLAERLGLE